jgi:hypothetical protein
MLDKPLCGWYSLYMDNITFGSFDTSFSALIVWALTPFIFYWAFIDKKKSWTSLGGFGKTLLALWTSAVLIKAINNQTTVADVFEITILVGLYLGYFFALFSKGMISLKGEQLMESLAHAKQQEADKELIRQAAKKIIQG